MTITITTIILWYIAGLISTGIFILVVNRQYNKRITYGDIALWLIMSWGGPLVLVTSLMFGIVWVIGKLCVLPIWHREVFNRRDK